MDISKINQSIEQMYSGDIDIIAQIIYELRYFPDSCLSVNLRSWYNSLYSASSTNDLSCSYQVRVAPIAYPALSEILQNSPLLIYENIVTTYLSSELNSLSLTMGKREYSALISRLKLIIK